MLISLKLEKNEKVGSAFDQSYETAYAKICPDPENAVHEIVPPTPPGPHPFNLCFESLSLQSACLGEMGTKNGTIRLIRQLRMFHVEDETKLR